MHTTRVSQRIEAPRSDVYAALLDADAIARWRAPEGMRCEVHRLDAREGGEFRVSLTYEGLDVRGKSSAHTDTYAGRFLELVPGERVVETMAFETDDPAFQGWMTITTTLTDADGGTDVVVLHEGVPDAVSAADNELGTRMALANLARLLGARDDAFQDRMHDNFCFGCGADNPDGLRLKSAWDPTDPDVAVATFRAQPLHAAGPRHILNGGIIATLLDCHGICTAVADAYRREGRDVGSGPELWYATAAMTVDYQRPAPIDRPVHLTGRVVDVDDRFTTVECELVSDGKPRARATVRAVRVPDSWRERG